MRLIGKKSGESIPVYPNDIFALQYRKGNERTTVLEVDIEREMVIDTYAIYEVEEGDDIADRLDIQEGYIGVFGASGEEE